MSIQMTVDEVKSLLASQQACTVGSLKKDGSPNVIALGYVYEDPYIYLSIRNGRALIDRVRRDPRVCVCVTTWDYPITEAVIDGRAEIVGDPKLSDEIMWRF